MYQASSIASLEVEYGRLKAAMRTKMAELQDQLLLSTGQVPPPGATKLLASLAQVCVSASCICWEGSCAG